MPTIVGGATPPNPYRKYQFRIKLDGKYIAGFDELSGSIVDATLAGNGEDFRQMATGLLTLKNGACYDVGAEEWQKCISLAASSAFRYDITLEVCDVEGLPVTEYKIYGCLLESYDFSPLESRSLVIGSMNVHYERLTLLSL